MRYGPPQLVARGTSRLGGRVPPRALDDAVLGSNADDPAVRPRTDRRALRAVPAEDRPHRQFARQPVDRAGDGRDNGDDRLGVHPRRPPRIRPGLRRTESRRRAVVDGARIAVVPTTRSRGPVRGISGGASERRPRPGQTAVSAVRVALVSPVDELRPTAVESAGGGGCDGSYPSKLVVESPTTVWSRSGRAGRRRGSRRERRGRRCRGRSASASGRPSGRT